MTVKRRGQRIFLLIFHGVHWYFVERPSFPTKLHNGHFPIAKCARWYQPVQTDAPRTLRIMSLRVGLRVARVLRKKLRAEAKCLMQIGLNSNLQLSVFASEIQRDNNERKPNYV